MSYKMWILVVFLRAHSHTFLPWARLPFYVMTGNAENSQRVLYKLPYFATIPARYIKFYLSIFSVQAKCLISECIRWVRSSISYLAYSKCSAQCDAQFCFSLLLFLLPMHVETKFQRNSVQSKGSFYEADVHIFAFAIKFPRGKDHHFLGRFIGTSADFPWKLENIIFWKESLDATLYQIRRISWELVSEASTMWDR